MSHVQEIKLQRRGIQKHIFNYLVSVYQPLDDGADQALEENVQCS